MEKVIEKTETHQREAGYKVYNREVVNNTENPKNENKSVADLIKTEGGEMLFKYLRDCGILKDHQMIVLPVHNHFYYEKEDFKNVSAVVNPRLLNMVSDLDLMIQSVNKLMSTSSNYIGCFAENGKYLDYSVLNEAGRNPKSRSKTMEDGIVSRSSLVNFIYHLLDFKVNRHLTKNKVNQAFKSAGFIMTDMTEINGIEYFQAKKVSS